MITQIRDAVSTALSGLTASVFVDRLYALERTDLPCVILSAADELVSQAGYGGGSMLDRSLTLNVTACVSTTGDFDAVANALQNDIEIALAADSSLGGKVTNVRLSGRNKTMNGDGDTPFCAITLNYVVTYRTMSNAPSIGE